MKALALAFALGMGCLPKEAQLHERAAIEVKRQSYQDKLDACYLAFIPEKDKRGYQQCHCQVNAQFSRPCPFDLGDAGHD